MRHHLILAAFFFTVAAVAQAAATNPAGFQTLEIGAAAPDFKLTGVDGREYSLKDFSAARLLLVVFTCNHCPTAQAYESRIMALDADYKEKGVALVAIRRPFELVNTA